MIAKNTGVTRRFRFRRLAWFGLVGLMIPLGCFADRAGLAIGTLALWGGTFEVRPMIICPGEPVVASWELHPTDVSGGALGLDIFLAWQLLTGDRVADGTRENRVTGGDILTPDPNMGSRTFFPMADRRFFFDATIEGIDPLMREQRDVRVVEMDPGGVRIRPEVFRFQCLSGETGGPGWTKIVYERGQLASANISIALVRNLSTETIRLSVLRNRDDEMLPSLFAEAFIPSGDTSFDFNGEYYGVWSAVPLSYTDIRGRLICDAPPTEGVLDVPPAPPGTLAEDRLDDVRIEVHYRCTMTASSGSGGGKG